jgi:hypothetical protein
MAGRTERVVTETDVQTAWDNLPVEIAAFAAICEAATTVTADRAWNRLQGFDIAVIR